MLSFGRGTMVMKMKLILAAPVMLLALSGCVRTVASVVTAPVRATG